MRKKLMESLMECRKRTGGVIAELKDEYSFNYLSNAKIAKLNDFAFKAVNNSSL